MTRGSAGPYVDPMEYRYLGPTGMRVSPLCLGAMMFGAWGEPDHDKSIAVIHRALDAGINFIDTADFYSDGESEVILAKALAGGKRDDVILATKVHFPMDPAAPGLPGGNPNMRGNSRRWIITEVENSLRRLHTDWIDLYQIHRPDNATDIEETLSALTDLRTQGKIRAFGSSTFPAHKVVEAQWVAEKKGLGRFVTEQPPYSILVRAIEADLLPATQDYGMGVITWGPLASGWLSGVDRRSPDATSSRTKFQPSRFDLSLPANQSKLAAVDALGDLAADAGMSLIHMALAFVMQHPAVTAPIIGPRTLTHLESQLGAVDVTLTTEILDRIDEIVPPGVTVHASDDGFVPDSVAHPWLRRRRLA
ncbi:MAG: aryl-alcohol dehydrogenase [Nocardioidaceae bacterium]|nr:aryl-alcohol dehydrogenase [Nocardioidaceae bacterium]